MHEIDDFRVLLDEAELGTHVLDACRARAGGVTVGVFQGESTAFARVVDGRMEDSSLAASGRTSVGCLAKGFTATLISQAIEARCFALDDAVADIDPRFRREPAFREVTVRHLLSHAHGLDMSAIRETPRTCDGYIHVEALIAACKAHPNLHAPGELCNYNNGGAWCAAAVLEHIADLRYDALLLGSVLQPLRIDRECGDLAAGHVCPARGGRFTLAVGELVTFLKWLVTADEGNADRHIARGIVPGTPIALPGWSLEHGVCLGWKYYGGGWYGHNVLPNPGSMAVRFNIRQQAGVIVAAEGRGASIVLARLCGLLMPEFLEMRVPRPLASSMCGPDLAWTPARFQNAVERAEVSRAEGGNLCIEYQSRTERGGRVSCSTLRPCSHETFMLQPTTPRATWVQFLRRSGSSYEYLWDGQGLLRRCA